MTESSTVQVRIPAQAPEPLPLFLEAALPLFRMGLSVIPACRPDHEGSMATGHEPSDRCGKRPLLKGWQRFSKVLPTEEDIRRWAHWWPHANPGVVLGQASGVIAFDVDGPEGLAYLRELLGGDPPETFWFPTPGGGLRYFYQVGHYFPVPSTSWPTPGRPLSLLGQFTYTNMPGAMHPNGEYYQRPSGVMMVRSFIAQATPRIVELVAALGVKKRRPGGGCASGGKGAYGDPDNPRRAIAYLDKCPRSVAHQGGNYMLYHAFLHLAAAGFCTERAMLEGAYWFDENKCDPPWGQKEVDRVLGNAMRIAGYVEPIAGRALGRVEDLKEGPAEDQGDAQLRRGAHAASCGGEPPVAMARNAKPSPAEDLHAIRIDPSETVRAVGPSVEQLVAEASKRMTSNGAAEVIQMTSSVSIVAEGGAGVGGSAVQGGAIRLCSPDAHSAPLHSANSAACPIPPVGYTAPAIPILLPRIYRSSAETVDNALSPADQAHPGVGPCAPDKRPDGPEMDARGETDKPDRESQERGRVDTGRAPGPGRCVRASQLKKRDRRWLWQDRAPLDELTLLLGDGDVGKTHMLLTIAAYATGGPLLPGMTERTVPVCNVGFFGGEDGAEVTILPRFLAAGGDPERLVFPELDKDGRVRHRWRVPEDLKQLRAVIRREELRLICADPWTRFLSRDLDENSNQDVESMLEALTEMLREERCTMIGLWHPRKDRSGPTSALGRGAGRIGQMARSVLLLELSHKRPGWRTVATSKGNGTVRPASLFYRIVTVGGSSAIEWGGESSETAEELAAAGGNAEDKKQEEVAVRMIREILDAGDCPSRVLKQRVEDAGPSVRSFRRALELLGLRPWQPKNAGQHPGWMYSRPEGGWPEGLT